MRIFSTLPASVCLLLASVGSASATPLYLGSFGQNNTTPSNSGFSNPGFANQAATFAGGTTYDLGTGNIWAAPLSVNGLTSSWIAMNPHDCPLCGHDEPFGIYTYTSTFLAQGGDTGSITTLADDTASIWLNGTLITPAALPIPGPSCTLGPPNCVTPSTFDLTGFVDGTNTLRFDVQQLAGYGEGVDFVATVDSPSDPDGPIIGVAPEPDSFVLLGTGLIGTLGLVRRRRAQV